MLVADLDHEALELGLARRRSRGGECQAAKAPHAAPPGIAVALADQLGQGKLVEPVGLLVGAPELIGSEHRGEVDERPRKGGDGEAVADGAIGVGEGAGTAGDEGGA